MGRSAVRPLALPAGAEAWRAEAACKGHPEGPEEFHAHDDEAIARAKAICQECPVVEECLDHALTAPELLGIWGGLDPAERAAYHLTAAHPEAQVREARAG